jgi:suppressor for copper-sensitivity B
MVRIRMVLGLALAGTAVWLLTVLAAVAGTSSAGVVAALMVLAAVAIWMAARRPAMRRAMVSSLLVIGIVSFSAPWIGGAAIDNGADQTDGVGGMGEDVAWRPFDLATIEAAVADGQTVFVDVTADWCVTCKVNKRLVLSDETVMTRLQAPGVLCMRADWTRPNNDIAKYLASFGRYGIPFNVVYGPGARDGVVLPELLDQDSVLSALDRAG